MKNLTKNKDAPKKRTVRFRSAQTGRFVSEKYAHANPATTVSEKI